MHCATLVFEQRNWRHHSSQGQGSNLDQLEIIYKILALSKSIVPNARLHVFFEGVLLGIEGWVGVAGPSESSSVVRGLGDNAHFRI